jgi:hypothetical protein
MLGIVLLLGLLLIAAALFVRWVKRAGRRYGEGRVAALRESGWEKVPVRHCRTINRNRFDSCPLVVIETKMRWRRVPPVANPLPASRPAREPPPRPLPSQRPRVR